ncbi:hypothetical protein pneo_cds_998 [Pandoravirus neocaledonia]|uniref:F-box incomplete domain containing protein n=1 Tax=Pandoravirus neocaledonia TaxID=2107708 RepID=A0A2U7UE20_9VIRU|nr:hypothetical protein pneo_cds_998 [Pandoravirus neocaledonia]AVK76605.1 hypothetical protein pneo_cds_998 [Pandoravirus neocaledonia]
MDGVASGPHFSSDAARALPQELWDRILNGADASGRLFLGARFRCLAQMVCARWHAIISTPSEADAARIIAASPRGRRFRDRHIDARRPAVAPIYASTAADLLALSEQRPVLALDAMCKVLYPDTRRDCAILLVAMAASGVDDYFDHVLSVIGENESCAESDSDGAARRLDASLLQHAVYIACVERGYARGAEALASSMTEGQWDSVLCDIVEADRPILLATALVHIGRRCKSRRDESAAANGTRLNVAMMAQSVWGAISRHGTLSTTRTVLDIQNGDGTSPFDVGKALRYYLDSEWHSKEWLRDAVRHGRMGVIEAHGGSVALMGMALEYAVDDGRLDLAQQLTDHHRNRGGTGLCGLTPADVAAKIKLRWRDDVDDGWCLWLASYGYGPTDDDARRILGRDRRRGPRNAPLDYIKSWPWQSALVDDGEHVINLLCADPPRFEWSLRERAMCTLAPYMLPRSTPIPNGLWSQAVARTTARIIKKCPRAGDTSAALLWLCRKARRWGLLKRLNGAQLGDAPSDPIRSLVDIPPEPDIWSRWVGAVSPLSAIVVDTARASCSPPTDLSISTTIECLLQLLDDNGLAAPMSL